MRVLFRGLNSFRRAVPIMCTITHEIGEEVERPTQIFEAVLFRLGSHDPWRIAPSVADRNLHIALRPSPASLMVALIIEDSSAFSLMVGATMGVIALPPGQFQFDELGEIGAGGLGRVDKIRITASNAASKPVGTFWARKRRNTTWNANPIMIERLHRESAASKNMFHSTIFPSSGRT